jgi:hypothetical protein
MEQEFEVLGFDRRRRPSYRGLVNVAVSSSRGRSPVPSRRRSTRFEAVLPYLFVVLAVLIGTGLASWDSSAAYACEGASLSAGRTSAAKGTRVEVEVRGAAPCGVTGFSFALGHDSSRLRYVEAIPGPWIVALAGDDLVFGAIGSDDDGYSAVYVFFDISMPITVLPTPIAADTVLATLVYDVLPDAVEGATELLNRTRTYGSPNPVANVFAATPGLAPIDPALTDGEVLIVGSAVTAFVRGDANFDSGVDISDPVYTLGFLFQGGLRPPCVDAADANDDGALDLSDAIFSLLYLFQGGPPMPDPGPHEAGPDPTPDALDCTP